MILVDTSVWIDHLARGDALQALPRAPLAGHDEVMAFLHRERLFGIGIGYVDLHLLASVRLCAGARLWTRDKRLWAAATRLALAAPSLH